MAHQNHDFFDGPHKYENGSYVPVEYEHQEYPKSVDGVIVNSAEEEAALVPKAEAEETPETAKPEESAPASEPGAEVTAEPKAE